MEKKPIKLRKPNNKYIKAYVKAVKKGYAKLAAAKKPATDKD